MKKMRITPGQLTLKDLKYLFVEDCLIELDDACVPAIHAANQVVNDIVASGEVVYGVNTGFGKLASTIIETEQLEKLQYNLVVSHAAGVGQDLPDDVVKLIFILKINSLARGFSGVRLETIEALIALYNAKVYPCIPEKGSVGASGDLAPLAHFTLPLLGEGSVRFEGEIITAKDGLAKAGLQPIKLAAKEGLALLNGLQVSTALGLKALFVTHTVFHAAIIAGCLSVEAALASHVPFDVRIQDVRGYAAQAEVAAAYRDLLQGSEIHRAHKACDRVQDPYSLRCQPQVMGACLQQIRACARTLLTEANAVSDNPVVFADTKEILSGGNFHGEAVAMAADGLALAIAEIGALSERRIALLTDDNMSQLPAFLVKDSGLNSGFMLAHVSAAACASENKSLAHPASVDSLPTSANQEDHVSMATFAARRLMTMLDNTASIIAIELIAANQGLRFHLPLKTSDPLEKVIEKLREEHPDYQHDRSLSAEIMRCQLAIVMGEFETFMTTLKIGEVN